MPGDDEEQQEESRRKQGRARVRQSQRRLLIDELASDTRVLVCGRRMLMEQPETVKTEQAQQRHLDDERAPRVLPAT